MGERSGSRRRARRAATLGALGAALLAGGLPATGAAEGLGCEIGGPGWGAQQPELANQVVRRLNAFRESHGRGPLTPSRSLTRAARWKAGHMVAGSYMTHTDPPAGRSPAERAGACGWPDGIFIGENIARGQRSPAAVMDAWGGSEGHRANMLNAEYDSIGVGVARGSDGLRWVQVLGRGEAGTPDPFPAEPAPPEDGSPRGSSGEMTLSATQLRINQRISQVAIHRVAVLEARRDGAGEPDPPARRPNADVTLSATQLRINQRISQAAIHRVASLRARVEGSEAPAPPRRSAGDRVTLSLTQLRINQRIGQAAIRRIAELEEELAS